MGVPLRTRHLGQLRMARRCVGGWRARRFGYQGQRFLKTNDLVFDASGGLWFTDPLFGGKAGEQPVMGVYYRRPTGEISLVIEDLNRPNGIMLSPTKRRCTCCLRVDRPLCLRHHGPGRGRQSPCVRTGPWWRRWHDGGCGGECVLDQWSTSISRGGQSRGRRG